MRRVAVLVLACVALAGCEDAPPTAVERGATTYAEYCAPCHGASLEGYAADNANALSNQNFLALATDDFLRDAIVYGRPGTPMSGWGEARAGPLSDEAVDDLVAFLRDQQTVASQPVHDDVVEGIATKGQAVWSAAKCDECHGDFGQGGGIALSVNNPWFLATASDGYLRQSIREGRPGTSMQGFEGVLGEIEIGDLVALIRSWQVPVDDTPLPPFTPTFEPNRDIQNLGGGPPSWSLKDDRFIGVDAVKAALDEGREMIILDARAHSDYVDGHVTGSVSIPFYDLDLVIDALPKDVWIINYCGCPHTVSGLSFDALSAAGFTNIGVLDEGYYVWDSLGYPTSQGE